MKARIGCLVLAAGFWLALPALASSDWQAIEQEKTYAVSGTSGAALYASIGARGPGVGQARAIAHTDFKLTWTRKYEPRGNSCVLASARPKLVITYTLPKPSQKLPAATARSWDAFAAGVRTHELVHGDFIKEMVRAIEAATVGLTVADDRDCKKIRTEMTEILSRLSQAQRQKSRDFDRVELSNGGNIHQLILGLVNGP